MNNPKSPFSLRSPTLLPPVITIDGPGGTGKGTVSQLLAKKLGWHYLDSGTLYRVLAFAALREEICLTDESQLSARAHQLPVSFHFLDGNTVVMLNGDDVTDAIRQESCGEAASKIAALPSVRQALIERQRAFRQWPGLVTDGRDMGTVIFPDATLKFFLHAELQERVKRRYKQLCNKGIVVSFDEVQSDLQQRDLRDQSRTTAPLQPAQNAIHIDTTHLTVSEVFDRIMQLIE